MFFIIFVHSKFNLWFNKKCVRTEYMCIYIYINCQITIQLAWHCSQNDFCFIPDTTKNIPTIIKHGSTHLHLVWILSDCIRLQIHLTFRLDPKYLTLRLDPKHLTFRLDPEYLTFRLDPKLFDLQSGSERFDLWIGS